MIAAVVLGVLWAVTPAALGFWALAELARIGDWLLGFDGPVFQTDTHVIPLYGVAVYSLLFMLTSGFGVLPTYAQAILGGWIFGFWLGVPAALLGFTGGALIGWVICRLISRDAIVQWVDRSPKWAAIRHAFVDEGFAKTFGVVTLVRIPPNSPFSLTNLAMSSGGVRMGPYLLGTLVGMAPRTAIACGFAAAAASSGSADLQEFVGDKGIWPLLIGAALLIGVFMILARIGKKALANVLPDSG
ncbi:MAG: VTT domain-containing protein [Planctomycetota bacterium]|nr:VTT domain-containing protein [Planctomycetota bacterium]